MPSTSFRHIKTAFPESSSLDQVLSKFLTHLYNLLACSWTTIDMSWKSFLKDLSRNLSLTWKDSTWFRHSTTESCKEVISLCKLDTTSSLSAIFCLKTIPKEDRNEIGNHQQNRLFLKEHQLARVLEQLQPVDLQALLNQGRIHLQSGTLCRIPHATVSCTSPFRCSRTVLGPRSRGQLASRLRCKFLVLFQSGRRPSSGGEKHVQKCSYHALGQRYFFA
jgi:hypothetical protein